MPSKKAVLERPKIAIQLSSEVMMLENSKQLVILDIFHLPFQEVVGSYDMIWRFPFCHGGTPTHTVVMTMTQYW